MYPFKSENMIVIDNFLNYTEHVFQFTVCSSFILLL